MELRMVPLRATEGAADMPSPSCGAVIYCDGHVALIFFALAKLSFRKGCHRFDRFGLSGVVITWLCTPLAMMSPFARRDMESIPLSTPQRSPCLAEVFN